MGNEVVSICSVETLRYACLNLASLLGQWSSVECAVRKKGGHCAEYPGVAASPRDSAWTLARVRAGALGAHGIL